MNGDDLVVVAGGTGVIGTAACRLLSNRGMRVLAIGRKCHSATLPDRVDYISCDLSCTGGVKRLVDFVRGTGLGIKGLVVALTGVSGTAAVGGLCHQIELVEALRLELARNHGAVVMLSSTAASLPFRTGHARFYAAEKAGVEGYVRAASGDFAPEVRINAVAPGIVAGGNGGTVHRSVGKHAIPLGRLVKPEEVAKAVGFLLLDCPAVTGQIVTVDGGMTASLAMN